MNETDNRVFEYEGRFYARPVYRGLCLDDLEGEGVDSQLEDIVYRLLGDAYSKAGHASGHVRIRIEVLSVDSVVQA